MGNLLRGTIHGDTIKLQDQTGLPDGSHVTVYVRPDPDLPAGEGIRRSAGTWSDDPAGVDAYIEWNRSQRKQSRRVSDQ